jgi:acetyl-CoA carboxylase biotin carboxyl carrier protein
MPAEPTLRMPRNQGVSMAAGAGKQQTSARERTGRSDASADRANGVFNSGAGTALIDLDFVRGLIEAMDASGIDTLEINRGGTRIRLSKTPPPSSVAANPAAPPAPVNNVGPAAPAPAPAEEPVPPPKTNLTDVKSPMVGTFYRAPAPEAPPYAEVGSHIAKGQTLCILEAMKLMNELESEVDGIVREVLVENADPVEYGQVLFRIEPVGSQA